VRFLYIRIGDHERFRRQTEDTLDSIVNDPSLAEAARSAIIYETGVELINELLNDPDLTAKAPRIRNVARAVSGVVLRDQESFRHLFAASHHDFYTATHMVNVATWMVSLAYAVGVRSREDLAVICEAGMLHDMGKLCIPSDLLNKTDALTESDWAQLRRHPVAGHEYLARYSGVPSLVMTVTRQHHERLDGSGYPDGLKGDQIHPASRICAVVDSFDAMTAHRPFKTRTLSVAEALSVLKQEAPGRYDQGMVDAWAKLVGSIEIENAPASVGPEPTNRSNRDEKRLDVNCPARMRMLRRQGSRFVEGPPLDVTVHSMSETGLGFLCQYPVPEGQFLRVYLDTPRWRRRSMDGQTVRCRTMGDCWHEVGIVFCKPSDGETPERTYIKMAG
jgi:HD-GYP domain-containing protein (c-di-GMP phosphodiesterase class II)